MKRMRFKNKGNCFLATFAPVRIKANYWACSELNGHLNSDVPGHSSINISETYVHVWELWWDALLLRFLTYNSVISLIKSPCKSIILPKTIIERLLCSVHGSFTASYHGMKPFQK